MAAETRGNYKAVWTNLSQTYHSAVQHVIGDVEENEIRSTARDTVHWLQQTVGLDADDVVLEIGCGIGRVGQELAPLCKEWIGCDVSPNMLAHARERLADVPNVRLVEISGFDLAPIPDASVDVVYCTVVFMHLDEWDRFGYIVEAGRVLKPGGRIFVDNFNLRSEEGWGIFAHHRQTIPALYRPPHMARSSTPQEIEVYLRRAGFGEIAVVENGAWVQGYGTKPADGGMDALFARERGIRAQLAQTATAMQAASHNTSDTQAVLAAQQRRLDELEQIIAAKNSHIQSLERLIARLENGRVLRLLGLLRRR